MRPPDWTWDKFFMGLAEHIATASKDPSTKVGAVIIRPDRTVASVGYNGFPRGVDDEPGRYQDRENKYRMIVHAETNAIISASESLQGYTIYVTFSPCSACAAAIIQAGIKKVVTRPASEELISRWGPSFRVTQKMFKEAGIEVVELKEDEDVQG